MVTDEDIDRALDWLVANASKAAQARANRYALEEFRKSLKAQIMSEHTDKALGAQERRKQRSTPGDRSRLINELLGGSDEQSHSF